MKFWKIIHKNNNHKVLEIEYQLIQLYKTINKNHQNYLPKFHSQRQKTNSKERIVD